MIDFDTVDWTLNNKLASQKREKKLNTRNMENVSIGTIPESEEQNAKNWYDFFKILKNVECRLDPRITHKDGLPYDPIDLTFRIVDAIKTLKEVRAKIADRFCFTEPNIHDYSFSES